MLFGHSMADLRALDLGSVTKQGFWIPEPKWSVNDIPDLTGKIVIVTGGSSGIGKETAKALLSHNAKVYLACRSAEKAEQAIADLEQMTGKRALFLSLDVARLQSVKQAVKDFTSKEKELHILINNAGIMLSPHAQLAEEGYDPQFHTNVTGHWYLTKLLVPIMIETAGHSPPKSVRVVHVSSVAHYLARNKLLDFESFKGGPQRDKYTTADLYAQSKSGTIVMSNEFHRRYADQGIVSISLNPGNIDTDLYRYADHKPILKSIRKRLARYPAELGAITQLYAGLSEEAGDYGGKFLIPWARLGKARPDTDDLQLGQELWKWLEEQVANI